MAVLTQRGLRGCGRVCEMQATNIHDLVPCRKSRPTSSLFQRATEPKTWSSIHLHDQIPLILPESCRAVQVTCRSPPFCVLTLAGHVVLMGHWGWSRTTSVTAVCFFQNG